MDKYNPNFDLNSGEWLSLTELERLDLVREFHEREKIDISGIDAHCSLHTVIENQLAEDSPKLVGITLKRLLVAGVSRHDAIHALANAMSQELFRMMKGNELFSEKRFNRDLQSLNPRDWTRADNQSCDTSAKH